MKEKFFTPKFKCLIITISILCLGSNSYGKMCREFFLAKSSSIPGTAKPGTVNSSKNVQSSSKEFHRLDPMIGADIQVIRMGSGLKKTEKAQIIPLRKAYEEQTELKVEDGDAFYVIRIVGGKKDFLNRVLRGMLNEIIVDNFTGVYFDTVNKQGVSGAYLTVLIKSGARDHRDVPSHEKLQNITEIETWVMSAELGRSISFLEMLTFDESVNRFKIYDTLKHNLETGVDVRESEFFRVYRKAFRLFFEKLNIEEMMYLTESFWASDAIASPKILSIYRALYQTYDTAKFEETFAAKTNYLRERLQREIHKLAEHVEPLDPTMLAESFLPESASIAVAGVVSSSLEANIVIPGSVSTQVREASDFHAGAFTRNSELSEVMGTFENSKLLQKVMDSGFTILAEVNGARAQDFVSRVNLSAREFTELASELAMYGVFFELHGYRDFYKIPTGVRSLIRMPKEQNFVYNPNTNSYRVKRAGED